MFSSTNILLSLTFAAGIYAQSQLLKSELSFGQDARISNDLTKVPYFNIIGEPMIPQILSNKIILTPPAPGSQRGAVWSEETMKYSAWHTDVEFRASGPEYGGGKLAVWLAKNGQQTVATSSIYTVGKFEGLGIGGIIRGFLNDGKIDYNSHHSVDSTAFGHCAYSYRNLGRLSQLRISQDHYTFKVEIDGNLCFETDRVQIPINYHWGITAVSADTPDSFEINALKVTAHTYDFDRSKRLGLVGGAPSSPNNAKDGEDMFSSLGSAASIDEPGELDASKIPLTDQFADLHNRLHALHQHLTSNNQAFMQTTKIFGEQLQTIETVVRNNIPPNLMDEIRRLSNKVDDLESRLQHIQSAVGDKWHIEDLKRTVEESHSTLLKKAPGLGMLLLIIVGSQAALVALYVVYKRRRANNPKKYL